MNKKILGTAIVAAGLALSTGAQAAFVVDDFSVDSSFTNAPGSETNTINSDFSVDREISITMAGKQASYDISGGVLAISTAGSTTSDTALGYANAAGFDFTAEETGGGSIFDTFFLQLLGIDQGGVQIELIVNGVAASQTVTAIGPVMFAHSLFGDVSNVNSIQYNIHNNDAVDATFDSFGSFGSAPIIPPTPSVPEPTALALLGMGLAAFGFGRRKAK